MSKIAADTRAMLGDRRFLKKTVMIAIPVAIQGLLNTVVNLVDNLMIGSLGSTAIAAVGLANKVFFVFSLLVFGIVSGSGILAAQYFGNKDIKNIRKVLGLALTLAVISALAFLIPARVCPQHVMRIFTASESSIAVGSSYLLVACLTYPFIAVTNTYVAMLRAVNQVKVPVVISCVAIATNIIFNYILIFGKLGAPALGVQGAALATLIARMLECFLIICVVYVGKSPLACRLKDMFGYSGQFLKLFFITASPVIANEFVWGLGTTIYSMAYGRMGDDAVAAITIATTIQDLVTVLFQGLSAATAVILGNEMGAGKLKRAEKYAVYFFILQFIVTGIGAVICILLRWNIIGLYGDNIPLHVAENVSRCLIVFACYMPFKMFNYVNIVGVLRSGGDTRMCLFIDISGVWLIGIPMAFLGGLFLKQPIYIVYAMVLSEEIYKLIIGYWRYRQKKWLRNLAVG
ncbi:MAG: MATE family efflux transporter [Lachnoclostridium edouardi]|uniref:MATE family efflux transporter n=1 Tax=Lachnoclostridium edouardi TaxID=1926283 RepID=UPI0026DA7552|nr:MATE family efflux transporter [Lachnoclostridium edouardi]MDO4278326.1 MATE family efflux transporter [Lachnoclostridium edouardi]